MLSQVEVSLVLGQLPEEVDRLCKETQICKKQKCDRKVEPEELRSVPWGNTKYQPFVSFFILQNKLLLVPTSKKTLFFSKSWSYPVTFAGKQLHNKSEEGHDQWEEVSGDDLHPISFSSTAVAPAEKCKKISVKCSNYRWTGAQFVRTSSCSPVQDSLVS